MSNKWEVSEFPKSELMLFNHQYLETGNELYKWEVSFWSEVYTIDKLNIHIYLHHF
jgi:hypothetical protein